MSSAKTITRSSGSTTKSSSGGSSASSTGARVVRKNWNFAPAEASSLNDILTSIMARLGNSAVIMVDGAGAKLDLQILAINASRAADIGTLPQAATLCYSYLKLRDRDIALLNDPSSGGTTLSDFTLVVGACFEGSGPAAELLLVKRISFPARISASGKVDDEGVRVPPMPIVSGGVINNDLISAMSAHPLAPADLADGLKKACAELLDVIGHLKKAAQDPGSALRKIHFKNYLVDSARMLKERMHRLPLGAKIVTTKLTSGETLKLALRIDEEKIHFDFAGSDGSTKFALTEMMTFGACLAVTASLFPDGLPMNAATFAMIQVSAPSRTLLSGPGQVGSLHSTRFVLAGVCDLVRSAFAALNPAFRASGGATASGHFQFEFADGKFWSGRLQPGSPARADAPGIDAYALWEPRDRFSFEDVESRFPLKVIGCGIRVNSGGRGQMRGGDGSFYSFEALAPCKARWALGPSIFKLDGAESGRAGQMAKIEIRRAGTTELVAADNNDWHADLAVGDQIHFFGAGSGGFFSHKEASKEAAD